MPKVESIITLCGGFWGGVGEPTICIAARYAQRLLWRGDQIIDNSVTKLLPQRSIDDRSGILFSSINSNLDCLRIGTRSFFAQGRHRPGGCQTISQK
jgi:hypothetical protein